MHSHFDPVLPAQLPLEILNFKDRKVLASKHALLLRCGLKVESKLARKKTSIARKLVGSWAQLTYVPSWGIISNERQHMAEMRFRELSWKDVVVRVLQ